MAETLRDIGGHNGVQLDHENRITSLEARMQRLEDHMATHLLALTKEVADIRGQIKMWVILATFIGTTISFVAQIALTHVR